MIKSLLKYKTGPNFITLILFVILMGLGTWQLYRLSWKEKLIADIDQRLHAAPINFSNNLGMADQFKRAEVKGIFDLTKTVYILSKTWEGKNGYWVVSAFYPDNSNQTLWINQGWLDINQKDQLDFSSASMPLEIEGIIRIPEKSSFFVPDNQPSKNEWYWIDINDLSHFFNINHYVPFYLELLRPQIFENILPIGDKHLDTLPNHHLSYALTWYGLALIMVFIFARYTIKNKGK
ncbi:MAG: SURF1 family protein [Alphaproteobacteria bacterium]|nr:SURF1 family protein [Alphaproteobacteria bacterium]